MALNEAGTDNDIRGGWSGSNNLISVDPLFVRNPSAGADAQWGTADDDYGDLRLRPGSPAINAGDNDLAVDADLVPLATDIRGLSRVYGSSVDIGAYENHSTHFVVTSLADVVADDGVVTLREALEAANTNTAVTGDVLAGSSEDIDRITFDAAALQAEAGTGNPLTIVLGGTQLEITDDVEILGLGQDILDITGNGDSRVMKIDGAEVVVSLSSLKIRGGITRTSGGGIHNLGTLKLTDMTISQNSATNRGGGIYNNNGTMILMNVTVIQNKAAYGSGIHSNGTMILMNVTVNSNGGVTAFYGGGILNAGNITLMDVTISGNKAVAGAGIFNSVTMTFTGGTVSGNTTLAYGAGLAGGGISNYGTLTLNDVDISGNTGGICGAGIYNSITGILTLENSVVSDNSVSGSVPTYGGGIFNGGTLTLTNSTVSRNSSDEGGGIYNEQIMTFSGGTISDNSAGYHGGGIYNHSGQATLTNVDLSGNFASQSGGGIYNYSTMTLTGVTVSENEALLGGGIVTSNGTMTLIDSIVRANIASFAAGITSSGGTSILTNSIISEIFNADGAMTLTNVTAYGINNVGTLTINNSIVTNTVPNNLGNWNGSNNLIGVDPMFVRNPSAGPDGVWGTADDDYGDLRLTADSPAVDAGDDALAVDAAGVPLVTDIKGNPRIFGPAIDIGAIEYLPIATISGRYVFYNNSSFDGNDPAANAADDSAIAPDKKALLPGQATSFANYTSFSRGINGVIIDIHNLPAELTAADFTFKVGNNDDPSTWTSAPSPASITVNFGAGTAGSDRVTIIWADNAIQNQWLEVTVLAEGNTNLGADDVFYFGNAIGETGNSATDARVSPADFVGVSQNQHFLAEGPTSIADVYDFNRDGKVGPTDSIICRDNGTNPLTALQLVAVPERAVFIPDANLAAAIRFQLGKAEGEDILPSDMATITKLSAYQGEIENLSSLEYCTNLKELNLNRNMISDLSPLSGLTELTELSLYYNKVSDLSPLSNMKGLTELRIRGNPTSDLSPLSGLGELTFLDASEIQVTDLSPLSGLTKLSELDFGDSQISDLSPLSNMTWLTDIDFSRNQISSISALSNLTKLTSLSLGGNKISDLSPLSNLTELTSLSLSVNKISDLSPLSNLTKLTSLYLRRNQISDLSPLTNLPGLTGLNLSDNEISDLSHLSRLTELAYLELGDNQVSDLSPLSEMTGLTWLRLRLNQISDLSALSQMTSMKTLHLDHNQISNLSPLSRMANLTSLHLDHNQISDLSPLSGMTKMVWLYLDNNQISNLSPLSGMTKMQTLDLDRNQVSDVSLLSGMPVLSRLYLDYNQINNIIPLAGFDGYDLYMRGNPLDPSAYTDVIPVLQETVSRFRYDQPGQISGTVFYDTNGNGVQGSGETGMAGEVVFLDDDNSGTLDWVDSNSDSAWNEGEGERWATTDANGEYIFDLRYAGEHTVVQIASLGWSQTTPVASGHQVTLNSDDDLTGLDFGNRNDIDEMSAVIAAGVYDLSLDFDSSGTIDTDDMDYLIRIIIGTEYGDANLDRMVTLADLAIVSANYGITEGATWSQGDFDGDGAVTLVDLAILAANYGFDGTAAPAASSAPMTAAIQSQPQPATAAITEPVEPATVKAETTGLSATAGRSSATAAYWQSQQGRKRRNSQRPAMRLLNAKPQNQWLGNDTDQDDEIDLLMIPDLNVM